MLYPNFSNWQFQASYNLTYLVGDSGYNIFEGLVEVGELAMDNLRHNLGCDGRSMQVESVSLMHPRGSRNHDRI